MSQSNFSLNLLEEQLFICAQSAKALLLTRNVLVEHIVRRLREYEDVHFDEKMQWNEKCAELEILALEDKKPNSSGKIAEIRRSYANSLDLIPCLRALTVVSQDGTPIFGKNVSDKSKQLKRQRNLTFHFAQEFNRENLYTWLGLIIELLHILGHSEEEAQVQELQNQLDIEGYRAFLRENQESTEQDTAPDISATKSPEIKEDIFVLYSAQIKTALSQEDSDYAVQQAVRGAKELIASYRALDASRLLQKVQLCAKTCPIKTYAEFLDAQAMAQKAQGHNKSAIGYWKKALALADLPENWVLKLSHKLVQCKRELETL